MRTFPVLVAAAGLLVLGGAAFANAPATGVPQSTDYVCKQAMLQEQRDLKREAAHGHLMALHVAGPKMCTSDKISQGNKSDRDRRQID